MANKMLIDSAHPEETRVVVVKGTRVEEFDYESALRKQLRGNIYLAKVTRVEPSLQAAFVDYGGNRHGFLAFSEIHPDYYQIPVADRQALLAEEAEAEKISAAQEDHEGENGTAPKRRRRRRPARKSAAQRADDTVSEDAPEGSESPDAAESEAAPIEAGDDAQGGGTSVEAHGEGDVPDLQVDAAEATGEMEDDTESDETDSDEADSDDTDSDDTDSDEANGEATAAAEDDVESVGSEDALEELPVRAHRRLRSYKIQEVIKRRQIILVQVVKEERGNKGAALTTYLSIAGRYAVLMPNTARGGGISRKITSATDRKRLRNIATEMSVPDGMGVIIRTAGAARTKTEIKRDFEYLLRLWENVRDLTLQSTAPALVYEEGSIIKRSIRDLYSKDIDEVLVAGDNAYKEAKGFMRMLMPSHAKNVQPYREPEPVFIRYQVERQLNAMFNPQVTLKSGGYVVINQTEALVSVDVNSGKATREHNIEDTALKTNMEAAEEIARQLRLRDLAGLIVIDFIDMDERRNNRSVERKLKECLRSDRARIQVGRISHFGLLEMSRQRLRMGVLEDNTSQCPFCKGTGIVRSTESVGLYILRSLEDTLLSEGANDLIARTSVEVALYILNQKRSHLRDIERRYGMTISVVASDQFHGSHFAIEKSQFRSPVQDEDQVAVQLDWALIEGEIEGEEEDAESESDSDSDADRKRPRKRRRRRRSRSDVADIAAEAEQGTAEPDEELEADSDGEQAADGELPPKRPRRRGRRGGRRARATAARRRNQDGESAADEPATAETEAAADDPDFVETEAAADEPATAETEAAADDPDFVETEAAADEPATAETEAAANEPAFEETEPAADELVPAETEIAASGLDSAHEPSDPPMEPTGAQPDPEALQADQTASEPDVDHLAGNGIGTEAIEPEPAPDPEFAAHPDSEATAQADPEPASIAVEDDESEAAPNHDPASAETTEEPETKTRRRGWWQRRTGLGG